MGSGKSTIGKKLSTLLNYSFIDLDEYIEQKTKKSIDTIFETESENYFRKLESECLNEIISNTEKKIISLGGGTVCFNNNLAFIKKSGSLIYIQLSANLLAQRIEEGTPHRPLMKNYKGIELIFQVEKMLQERKNYYEQAHITVNGLNLTAQLLHQKLIELS